MGFKDLPEAGELLRVVKNQKMAKEVVDLNDYITSFEGIEDMMKDMNSSTKISFKSFKEKRAFYSGKTDEIIKKYESDIERFKEEIKEKSEYGEPVDSLEKKLKETEKLLDDLTAEEDHRKCIILKAKDFGTLETMQEIINSIEDSNGSFARFS